MVEAAMAEYRISDHDGKALVRAMLHAALLATPAPEAARCGGSEPHLSHHMPCDSGCQPDWHKDGCAIYGDCPGLPAPDLPTTVQADMAYTPGQCCNGYCLTNDYGNGTHAADKPPCPTCQGSSRETTGTVCQTCGTNYATVQADRDAGQVRLSPRVPDECGCCSIVDDAGLDALIALAARQSDTDATERVNDGPQD